MANLDIPVVQNVRRAFLQYLTWLVLSGAVVWYTASLYKKDETTVANVIGELSLCKVDRLWFNPAGGFLAQRTDGLTVRAFSVLPEGDKGKPLFGRIGEWEVAADARGRRIVTGDFERRLMFDGPHEPGQLGKLAKGTSVIAVSPTHMMYAGAEHAGAFSVHIVPAMSTNALWIIKVWLRINAG